MDPREGGKGEKGGKEVRNSSNSFCTSRGNSRRRGGGEKGKKGRFPERRGRGREGRNVHGLEKRMLSSNNINLMHGKEKK